MHSNIYKIYNIYIYIYTKYQAAAARPGPEPPGPDRGPRRGTGPCCRRLAAAAWYSIYIFFLSSCIYLNIFGYVLVFYLVTSPICFYWKSVRRQMAQGQMLITVTTVFNGPPVTCLTGHLWQKVRDCIGF